MIISSDTSGIESLIARIEVASLLLPGLVADTAQIIGDAVVQELADAAPVGQGSGDNPPGDAEGHLSDSFYALSEQQAHSAMVEVFTNQPLKLKFVTEGRGEVLPVNKRALYWEGLAHPIMRAKPSQANPFVEEVLAAVDDHIEPEMQAVIDNVSAILQGE